MNNLLPELSIREAELMAFLAEYKRKYSVMPSMLEINQKFGWASNATVSHYYDRLVAKRYISRPDPVDGHSKARQTKFNQTIGTIPIIGTCN